MIQSFAFHAETPGPRLLILGGVHGNESCGILAARRLIAELQTGALDLVCGKLTIIPVCNPRAFAQGVRYTERNLNRNLVPMAEPDCYEARLGNILCPILAACDYLVDLHSYTAGGPPFLFLESVQPGSRAFAEALGSAAIVTGWDEAFAAHAKPGETPDWGIGTTNYANLHGAISVTFECGQHQDPAAPEAGYRAVRRALAHLGMAAYDTTSAAPPRRVRMREVYYRSDAGNFARPWGHLDRAAPHELIATRASGEELRAGPEGAVLVLPNAQALADQEWFYLGTEEPD